MATRDIVQIDQELCDGCGDCITACAEGAIALVDGKATLVSDVYCDGLGACLGHCPQGAISVIRREAVPFDEAAVARRLQESAPATSLATLTASLPSGGCPGSRQQSFNATLRSGPEQPTDAPTALRQWPVQLHLLSPSAPFLHGSDLLLAADCIAFSVGGFHRRFLAGHSLAIACPKLDSQQEIYLEKLIGMINHGGIASLTVMVMEVPCCNGLVRLAEQAVSTASRHVPLHRRVISVRGEVLSDSPLTG